MWHIVIEQFIEQVPIVNPVEGLRKTSDIGITGRPAGQNCSLVQKDSTLLLGCTPERLSWTCQEVKNIYYRRLKAKSHEIGECQDCWYITTTSGDSQRRSTSLLRRVPPSWWGRSTITFLLPTISNPTKFDYSMLTGVTLIRESVVMRDIRTPRSFTVICR